MGRFVDYHQPPVVANKKDDLRISVCVLCNAGVFKGTEYKFTSNGYTHTTCEDRRLNAAEDVT